MTQNWWDELWLQEALGNFYKYKALQRAYPEWNIVSLKKKKTSKELRFILMFTNFDLKYQQFVTEELIYVLVDDG